MGLDGQKALYDIDRYIGKRESAQKWLQDSEKSVVDVVYRDSLQAAYQREDAITFKEFERSKQVELEYLQQSRGIRQAVPSAIFQEGYAGCGNSWTGSKIRLLYPQDRKRSGRESREPFLPINKIHETTQIGTQLVPLHIDLKTEKYVLRDRLVWNADDTTIPLELFVENLLEDYGLPLSLASEVLKSLQLQINSHLPHIYPRRVDDSGDAVKSQSDKSDAFSQVREKAEEEAGKVADLKEQQNFKYDEDMRITIKIDVTIGQHQLVDQFEWDLNNPQNNPEWFATTLAAELSLPGEFATAVAHAIREQCQMYSRTLFNSGYQFDGKPPHVPELRDELAMPVDEHAFLRRPEAIDQYTPSLRETRPFGADQDPHELEQERREMRSRRRQGRSRRFQHDAPLADFIRPTKETSTPDISTPIFSSILPGGVDRNLSILHMVAYREDDMYGGDQQDLVYYFNRNRKRQRVPTASLFDESLVQREKPSWIVKLRLPPSLRNNN